MIFSFFHIEIEGKGVWIIGGGGGSKGYCGPSLKLLGGGGGQAPLSPPLPTPMKGDFSAFREHFFSFDKKGLLHMWHSQATETTYGKLDHFFL